MQHRVVVGGPPRWPWVALSFAGCLALAGWGLALALMFNALPPALAFLDPDLEGDGHYAERMQLRQALDQARDRADRCESDSSFSERGEAIDAQACEMLRDSIDRLEAEGSQLREQLAFYRSIATPEQSKAGLRIVSLTLVGKDTPGTWGYEMMVLQPVLNAAPVNASYRISLVGKVGGQAKTLTMGDAVAPSNGTSDFSVKTFATLSGTLNLPKDFKPGRAEVTIEVVGSKGYAGKLSETYSWAKLVAAAR